MGEEGDKAIWARQYVTFSSSQTIVLQPTQVPDIYKELEKLQIDKMEYSVTLKRKGRRYDIIERVYTSNCEYEQKPGATESLEEGIDSVFAETQINPK
jgi:hypothetical protein